MSVEIADEPFETQRGLMFRTRLDPDAGMLFVYDTTKTTGYYMANTKIPLSIAYMRHLGKGRFEVVRVLDMEPCREADPDDCPTYPPGVGYNAALEVNQGWFDAAGVDEGDVGVFEPGP